MKEWSTACPDWESRIVSRESLIACQPLFPEVATEAWEICSQFVLTDVMGQPLLGEASLPWLREFVMAVFGAEDPETGRRHINEFMLMVSKKNAKSTIAAAIMLCALLMNWRQSAELLILSPTKEIADNSYKPIRDFIKADEELSAMLKVQDYFRTITHLETGATLKVVAADSDTVSGKKASFVFVDELHEFGKQAKASNMLLEATGGLASRPEGFVIYATTQSAEPPAGVFKAKLDYARKVRDGRVTDRKFLPVIYEFPRAMLESKAYEDLNNAYITNPNWGASVDIERITQLHSQAKESGEQEFKEFLAKHLNVEIGLNLRSDRWAGADFWESAETVLTLDELLQRCEVAVVGGDGGGLDDLLGQAVVGRERETGRWLAWFHAWAHKIALERRKEIAPRLLDFQREGFLTIVDRPGQDVQEFADNVCRVRDAGLLPEQRGIGVDAAGIGDIVDELAARDFDPEKDIVAISQGWRLTGAIKTTERKLAGGDLLVAASSMMRWSVGNARTVQQGNAVSITKQASGTAKIDPLMALFDAVSLMALNPESNQITQGFVEL
ncbi:MAG TPA: terminase large subunit [Noviherbaspirillum sp.]|uniref:terminase large subunit n=1 Tax=Noviherbaspirillum sp. TaxID=1926288 RepID=UPI002DDD23FE|nr:terminase large subunit [Noviherbaspirillum sp.]HEV2612528.1 terminase large subunit [Noviherbaspirillum sp.]